MTSGPDAEQTPEGAEKEKAAAAGADPWTTPSDGITTVAATSVALGGTVIAAGAVLVLVRRRRRLVTGVHEDDYESPYQQGTPELAEPQATDPRDIHQSTDSAYEYYARRYPNVYGDGAVDEFADGTGDDRRSDDEYGGYDDRSDGYDPGRGIAEFLDAERPAGTDEDRRENDRYGSAESGPGRDSRDSQDAETDDADEADTATQEAVPPAEPYKRPKPVAYDRSMEAELAAWEPEDGEGPKKKDPF